MIKDIKNPGGHFKIYKMGEGDQISTQVIGFLTPMELSDAPTAIFSLQLMNAVR